jgi:hypothetical protein
MRASVAAIIAILAVLAAVGIGLASGRLFTPTPTPIRVNVTFTPAPTPSPTPYDEAGLFRSQPLSGGCATSSGVWVITNGGGLLRFDGTQWARVDDTLRSLVKAACTPDVVYAVGLVGAVLVVDEQSRQIRSTAISIEDLFGISTLPEGNVIVGTRGSVFSLDATGDVIPAVPVDEDLFGVVAFQDSAWIVGDRGITYRLDQRGLNPVGSGQVNTLRAVAGLTAASVIAVGDKGTIVTYNAGWHALASGVDVTLRDITVGAGLWIAGDAGTLLTTGSEVGTFRKVDLRTTCDLVAVFTQGGDVWVVGRPALGGGGGVWRLRNGAVNLHFGGC